MNVLSLFDGMSCGRLALERAGFPIHNYFASEIDKYAIQVAKANFPDTVHLGDVTGVKTHKNGELFVPLDRGYKIDLLIGGSPCQGFSFAGRQLNFDDPRSKLFFEFVRLLKALKPKYFLLENVNMKQEYQDVISDLLMQAYRHQLKPCKRAESAPFVLDEHSSQVLAGEQAYLFERHLGGCAYGS